jgi:hypothetical protein
MTSGSWTRRRRQAFPSTRPPDRNRRYRHPAKQRLWLVGPPASAASAGHPRLVRGTVDAELSPIPARRRRYHPTAADMAAVAELVLAALTADHGGTSA